MAFSDIRIQTLVSQGNKAAVVVKRLKANLRKLLGTLLLGQTFCDIAASSIATYTATKAFGSLGIGLVTGALTLLVLIIGNLIPKSLAAHHPDRWTLRAAGFLEFVMKTLGPVISGIDRLVGLFVDTKTAASFVSEDEIKTMAAMGAQAGTVEKLEKEMIDRVFLFNDITAEDVMTPKENMILLDGEKTVTEVIPLTNAAKFSRYPVFLSQKDNIVGIIHIKDIYEKFSEVTEKPLSETKVKEIMKNVIFIPETKLIGDLFREFQKHRMHQAVVVNEYGTVTGLVTLEDLIEELVGEISDETDVDENIIKRVDKYTIVVHGDIELRHVNRFFNTNIGAEGHKTLSRHILEVLGSIPAEGHKLDLTESVQAIIEQGDSRRISKVRLVKKAEATKPE